MARFDVYRGQTFDGLVLDCQADLLAALPTRLMVPLIPAERFDRLYARLNPVFQIDGVDYSMATQMAAAVPVRSLGECLTSLAVDQSRIMDAIDMLLTGY
jgi:toxin CcdB